MHLRFEVRERLDASGNVIVPLECEDLRPIIAQCLAEDIDAVAILFLHSYANPEHEMLCASILADALPFTTVCASHEVSRQWREYERSNTVVLNAYVQPIIRRYFEQLEESLARRDLTFRIMRCGRTRTTFKPGHHSPLPVGSARRRRRGAARIGTVIGESEVLSLDVGHDGKCSLIHSGRPTLNVEYKWNTPALRPVTQSVPVVDIVEIGPAAARSPGSTIAARCPWAAVPAPRPVRPATGVAAQNHAVGCHSDPHLRSATFAGGSIHLANRRPRPIATVAQPLGLCIEDAALAIIDIAHASMIMRLLVRDAVMTRDAVFVVSGSAGPALATRLGRDLSVKATVIPPHPVSFRMGHAGCRTARDFRGTWFAQLSAGALTDLGKVRKPGSGGHRLFRQGQDADIRFTYQVEARYRGGARRLYAFQRDDDVGGFAERFHAAHERSYSFRLSEAAIEITTLHLEAVLNGTVIALPKLEAGRFGAVRPDIGMSGSADQGWISCPVLLREAILLRPIDRRSCHRRGSDGDDAHSGKSDLSVTDTGILIIREQHQGR